MTDPPGIDLSRGVFFVVGGRILTGVNCHSDISKEIIGESTFLYRCP